MTSLKSILTADVLRSVLHYEPTQGVFTWLVDIGPVRVGQVAGAFNKNGYLQIQINGQKHRANRLAWLWMNGVWPAGVVDHRDGNTKNDRFANLRDVTRTINMQNQRQAQKHSETGLLGVSAHYGKYQARIRIGGKQVRLGTFETAAAAHAAYLSAKRDGHEGCTL